MKKPQAERGSQLYLQQHTEISRAGQEAQAAPGIPEEAALLWLFWTFTDQRHRQIPFCGDTPTKHSIMFDGTAKSYSN